MADLENTGSQARDHLAKERTFLAWVRTALGVIGLGVVLEKLVGAGPLTAVAGAVLILYGATMLVYALIRYHDVMGRLEKGAFPLANAGPTWMALGGVAVALASLVLLLL